MLFKLRMFYICALYLTPVSKYLEVDFQRCLRFTFNSDF